MTKMTNKYISLVCDGVTYHETGIDISWSSSRGFGQVRLGCWTHYVPWTGLSHLNAIYTTIKQEPLPYIK